MQERLVWRTAEGENVSFDKMTHEHISNIYHYCNIYDRQGAMHPELIKRLNEVFGGEILPYKPKYKFEVEELRTKNMIVVKHGEHIIFYNNRKIGVVPKELLI
jgi:hypothetical protein